MWEFLPGAKPVVMIQEAMAKGSQPGPYGAEP